MADPYLDLITTYSIYAKELWQDDPAGFAAAGGYWGDGIAAKNQNGAVRGMCNTLLGYAMLVHAIDQGWLDPASASRLGQAGLSREQLLSYIRANLKHLVAHHKTTPNSLNPQWGFHWQSSLWLGAAGPAVMLVWDDLPQDLRDGFMRIAAAEADRIANKPPKDYIAKDGDTGAEENAWDTHAPAVALAIEPGHPHAAAWLDALKRYAMNVYSIKTDHQSDQMLGSKPLRDWVTTTNLFEDFTLENHGFFHPDYVQVSGQHLGEALLFLQIGDRWHGTRLAEEFRPFATHHVQDVWERVMRPLLLDTGAWAFPNGTDWTQHCSMTPSYLACIATLVHDPVAIRAERDHLIDAMNRRKISPPGRILGDSNLEWWWEPLLIKRCSTALLQHEMRDGDALPADTHSEPEAAEALLLPNAHVWLFRNSDYFASAAWGKRHMGTFYPSTGNHPEERYLTVPIHGILPREVIGSRDSVKVGDATVLSLSLKDGRRCAVVCLPHSVLWISPVGFPAMGIQNDKLSGNRRAIAWPGGRREVPGLVPLEAFDLDGGWADVDDRLGLISSAGRFRYAPAGRYNAKSLAVDTVAPVSNGPVAWQMLPHATAAQTAAAAKDFAAKFDEHSARVVVRDGADEVYRVVVPFDVTVPVQVQKR